MNKIFYFIGNEINLNTKVKFGYIFIEKDKLVIKDKTYVELPYKNIENIELLKINFIGTTIKITTNKESIFLSIIRFKITNNFIILNYFKTIKLYKFIKVTSKISPE